MDARVKVAAKEIAKSLNMTAQLVGQLKGLVQRRSLFNDRAHSINENAAAVKKNISHLRAQLSALVKLVAARGGTEGVRGGAWATREGGGGSAQSLTPSWPRRAEPSALDSGVGAAEVAPDGVHQGPSGALYQPQGVCDAWFPRL